MAVLVRLFDFIPGTLIQSAQVDSEFNQLINILSGVSTDKEALIKLNHATTPPLTLDQVGAGAIQSWKQNGVEVASVLNTGAFSVGASLSVNATTPFIDLVDTDGEDFRFLANTDEMTVSCLTGPISFMKFRGGANDDVQLLRNTTILPNLNSLLPLTVQTQASPTTDIVQFKNDTTVSFKFKSNGHLVGYPKTVHVNGTATGNVGAGVDTLHTFDLPAASLASDGDWVDVVYGGTFAANDQDKRIVLSFGGQTYGDTSFDQDQFSWYYGLRILRLSSTTVRVVRITAWGFISRDGGGTAGGNGFLAGDNSTLTVSNLNSNAMTMLVQAESVGGAPANNDIVQNASIIQLCQIT